MINKIAFISIHWLGDSFWDAQLIPKLIELYPKSEIYFICKSPSKYLFSQYLPEKNILCYDSIISDRHREQFSIGSFYKDIKSCRKLNFTEIIDLSNNRYSALFSFLSGVKRTTGLKDHGFSFLYKKNFPGFDYSRHLSTKPWYILRQIHENLEAGEIKYFPKLLSEQKEKTALLVPGAGWSAKQWPAKFFVEVGCKLQKQGYDVWVSGSPKEEELVNEVQQKIIGSYKFEGSLPELFQLIAKVRVSMANDSGPGHLLAAAGSRHAALFTDQTKPQKCSPLGQQAKIFHLHDVESVLEFLLEM